MQIEILFPPEGSSYDEASIRDIVAGPRVQAQRGGEFTGRPSTHVLVGRHDIVKLRTEYAVAYRSAVRFVEDAVGLERELAVHHPAKAWFLIRSEDAGMADTLIANITPRLQALHEAEKLVQSVGFEDFLEQVRRSLDMALAVAKEHDRALDLGLSNFGLDGEGALYYLDDEVYPWDEFTSLSQHLALLVRSLPWFNETHAYAFGAWLHDRIMAWFADPHWTRVITEELRGVYLAPERRVVMTALIEGASDRLASVYRSSVSPSNERAPARHVAPVEAKPVQTEQSPVLALLADVHANAPALEAVLNALAKKSIDRIIVLGDVVGYGPHPEQCVAMLQGMAGVRVIQGNHDHAVVTGQYARGFSHYAQWVIDWSRGKLTEEAKQWLALLPVFLHEDDWYAVHGAPLDRTFFNAYVYEMTYEDNLENLAARGVSYCFHGHTHVQQVYYRDERRDGKETAAVQRLGKWEQALICPGSVGQSRGGRCGAEFALFDAESKSLEMHSLPYDTDAVIQDMNRFHFPANLSDRLLRGV